MVFLSIHFYKNGWYTHKIGSGAFFSSFFNTIAHLLENRNWGSKYPTIMKEFYQGNLAPENIDTASEELKNIHEELKKFPPSAVVWDYDDLSIQPPWGDNISEDITNMGNYFATSDGAEDLFEVIFKAFKDGKDLNKPVIVESL